MESIVSEAEFLESLSTLCAQRPDVRFVGSCDGTVSIAFNGYRDIFEIGFAGDPEEIWRIAQLARGASAFDIEGKT